MNKRPKAIEPSLLGHYAGFVSRFLAVLIDIVIIISILIVLGWITGLLISFFNLQDIINFLLQNFTGHISFHHYFGS